MHNEPQPTSADEFGPEGIEFGPSGVELTEQEGDRS